MLVILLHHYFLYKTCVANEVVAYVLFIKCTDDGNGSLGTNNNQYTI